MMLRAYVTIFLSLNALIGSAQNKGVDTILFAKDGLHALVYDFYLDRAHSMNVWHLYSSTSDDAVISIIESDDIFYELDMRFWEDSMGLEHFKRLDIDSITDQYELYVHGRSINNEVTSSIETSLPIERAMKVDDMDTFESYTSRDIKIHLNHLGDTILTIAIVDFAGRNIDEFLTQTKESLNRPYPVKVYGEDGYLRGWSNQYSHIFQSDSSNLFFVNTNFYSMHPSSVSIDKNEEGGESWFATMNWWYEGQEIKVRKIVRTKR